MLLLLLLVIYNSCALALKFPGISNLRATEYQMNWFKRKSEDCEHCRAQVNSAPYHRTTLAPEWGKNDPNNPIGQEGQDFVTEFNNVANDSKTSTAINITDNDTNVLVVDLSSVTIDVGDLETVDAKNLPSKTGAGIMMHEIVEQQGMQNGISASTAHNNGIATENKVDGSTRTSYREGITSDGHHVMMIGTTTSQGTSSTVRVFSKNKNVVTAYER